jgi:hypothetical protein
MREKMHIKKVLYASFLIFLYRINIKILLV